MIFLSSSTVLLETISVRLIAPLCPTPQTDLSRMKTRFFICCEAHLSLSWRDMSTLTYVKVTCGISYEWGCELYKPMSLHKSSWVPQVKTIKVIWIHKIQSSVLLCNPGKENINNLIIIGEGTKHSQMFQPCQLSLCFFSFWESGEYSHKL